MIKYRHSSGAALVELAITVVGLVALSSLFFALYGSIERNRAKIETAARGRQFEFGYVSKTETAGSNAAGNYYSGFYGSTGSIPARLGAAESLVLARAGEDLIRFSMYVYCSPESSNLIGSPPAPDVTREDARAVVFSNAFRYNPSSGTSSYQAKSSFSASIQAKLTAAENFMRPKILDDAFATVYTVAGSPPRVKQTVACVEACPSAVPYFGSAYPLGNEDCYFSYNVAAIYDASAPAPKITRWSFSANKGTYSNAYSYEYNLGY